MRLPTASGLLLVAVLAGGCGDDQGAVEDLRAELETRQERDQRLDERLAAVEDRLDEPPSDESDDALTQVEERLDQLAGDLAGLEEELAAERGAREELAGELESTAGDLRSVLTDVRGELEALRGETEDLRVRYEILQERLDERG